jgi:hypothetical protein
MIRLRMFKPCPVNLLNKRECRCQIVSVKAKCGAKKYRSYVFKTPMGTSSLDAAVKEAFSHVERFKTPARPSGEVTA